MRVKTFAAAEYLLQREHGYWVVRSHDGSYAVVASGTTWREAETAAKLPKSAKILNRETHVCEATGCTSLTTTVWCPYHHFTKEDGSPRAIGILGLPLED